MGAVQPLKGVNAYTLMGLVRQIRLIDQILFVYHHAEIIDKDASLKKLAPVENATDASNSLHYRGK